MLTAPDLCHPPPPVPVLVLDPIRQALPDGHGQRGVGVQLVYAFQVGGGQLLHLLPLRHAGGGGGGGRSAGTPPAAGMETVPSPPPHGSLRSSSVPVTVLGVQPPSPPRPLLSRTAPPGPAQKRLSGGHPQPRNSTLIPIPVPDLDPVPQCRTPIPGPGTVPAPRAGRHCGHAPLPALGGDWRSAVVRPRPLGRPNEGVPAAAPLPRNDEGGGATSGGGANENRVVYKGAWPHARGRGQRSVAEGWRTGLGGAGSATGAAGTERWD